ncbi:MAG: hypothetical protein WEA82_09845 [Idiomarina sp.]
MSGQQTTEPPPGLKVNAEARELRKFGGNLEIRTYISTPSPTETATLQVGDALNLGFYKVGPLQVVAVFRHGKLVGGVANHHQTLKSYLARGYKFEVEVVSKRCDKFEIIISSV